tara:strand:- start:4221 stop:4364 length:144 start_codon:yes stop_codon:yes gene_type:complete
MHGGKSTGAPKGNQNAFKNGLYTAEIMNLKAMVMELSQDHKSLMIKI